MDFDTKFSNNSCHLSNQSNFSLIFFFQHTYIDLNEKIVYMFLVKSHESKISIIIVVQ